MAQTSYQQPQNPYMMGTVNLNQPQVPSVNIQTPTYTPPPSGSAYGDGSYNFGSKGSITQPQWDASVSMFKSQNDPFFRQQTAYDTGNYNRDNNRIINDYERLNQTYANNLYADLDELNDQEGRNGTWGSSARAIRRERLQNKYNDMFANNFADSSYNLGKNRFNQAYQYGDSSILNNSPLMQRYANLGIQDVSNIPNIYDNGSGGQYSNNGFAGRKLADESYAAEAAARDYWDRMINQKISY